ncbi:MAG: ribosomal protein [Chloroflexi bacterium]|jgi:small subunit ribosomal protein S9|nr:ribosomal protein [Chloroflexota bacterium]MDB5074654.1 ribosomal protein [Chloroflexota bacterium]
MAEATLYHYGLGRRKCAVARVRLLPGDGRVVINGKSVADYFGRPALEAILRAPLVEAALPVAYNVVVKVVGGGHSGQAGAIRHGIARALVRMDEELRPAMRRSGFLTRDSRVKERKKYGLKRARKAPQYTKR